VGLSYVFPNGIKRELLDKDLKNYDFKKPIDLVNLTAVASARYSLLREIAKYNNLASSGANMANTTATTMKII